MLMDRDIKINGNSELNVDEEKELNIFSKNPDRVKTSSDIDDKSIDYLDFELEIGSGKRGKYPVTVLHSPAGETHEDMKFPFDELTLESRLKDIQIAILSSIGNGRTFSSWEKTIRDFGQNIFDSLLKGEVRSAYDVSLREAKQQGKGLRLKLRIKPPELAALPWEFLYDSRFAKYISLSRNTPLVRYIELPQVIQPLITTLPIHILGVISSPRDLPPLNVQHEKKRMEDAIKDLRDRGMVNVTWLEGQTWHELQRIMRKGPWHIFHFIGHGGFDHDADEGFIALEDEEGKMFFLSASQLGMLLANHNSLRLALLNSCEGARGSEHDIFSSTAAILIRQGIPAVLAMQYTISDRAAIEFSRIFYESLADEMPVDAAVSEARLAVNLAIKNTVEWGTPVLYMRSPDGVLFKIQKSFKEFCPECGRENVNKREFCGKCGARLYRTGQ
jgi:ribosomal protein S27AE